MATKVTEGVGFFSGDMECFCISAVTPEVWEEIRKEKGISEAEKLRIYPEQLIPEEFLLNEKKVRYKITVEAEEV